MFSIEILVLHIWFRVEEGGRRLWIYTETEQSNWDRERDKDRRMSNRRIRDELRKMAGIFWCEFQYCYEKKTLTMRQHAIVKCRLRSIFISTLHLFTLRPVKNQVSIQAQPFYEVHVTTKITSGPYNDVDYSIFGL